MNIVFEACLPEELSAYVQSLFFEMLGARNLAAYAATAMPEAYGKLSSEYMESYKRYSIAMDDVLHEFVPAEFQGAHFNMEILFGDNKLQVRADNAGQVFQCRKQG